MSKPTEMLSEFVEKFEVSHDANFWDKLVREEINETFDAFVHLIKEIADVHYTVTGFELADRSEFVPAELTPEDDAKMRFVMDLIPFLEGSDFFKLLNNQSFRLVHESNMSKLGEDGKPLKREDGKVLKGPNYVPAEPAIHTFLINLTNIAAEQVDSTEE